MTFASTDPDDGGSPIVSYELQIDDGLSGEFVSVQGFTTNSLLKTATITSGINKGRDYRLRYRV